MPTPHRSTEHSRHLASSPTGGGASSAGVRTQSQMAVFSADLQGEFSGLQLGLQRNFSGYSPGKLLGRDFSVFLEQKEKTNREDHDHFAK